MTDDGGLSIRRLAIAFDRGRTEAVSDLTLEVPPGAAVGLVGESGSGKSLTARAALGLLPRGARTTGELRFEGQSVLGLSPTALRRLRGAGIAMIFQDPMSSLNPVTRVGRSIAQVVLSHEKVSARAAMDRAVKLMDRVGIRNAETRAASYPHEFSGGMRQRIMIAMALAARPRMLLADEPTTALDVIVQHGILELLDNLRREHGMGLLLVSHDLAVVASACERIAVMYAGQIVEDGPADQVLRRPQMPYTVGLLASTQRDKGRDRLTAIPGAPPPPGSRPAGCRFADRCPLVVEACRAGTVDLSAVGDRHLARCIRPQAARALDPADFGRLAAEVGHG